VVNQKQGKSRRYKAVEQNALSSPLRMAIRRGSNGVEVNWSASTFFGTDCHAAHESSADYRFSEQKIVAFLIT